MTLILIVTTIVSLVWAIYYLGRAIYNKRWFEAFIDGAAILPWPVLLTLGFWVVAAIAQIWSPNSDTGRKWFAAGGIVGILVLLVAWFCRAVLWVAPDAFWPENQNTGKVDSPVPAK